MTPLVVLLIMLAVAIGGYIVTTIVVKRIEAR